MRRSFFITFMTCICIQTLLTFILWFIFESDKYTTGNYTLAIFYTLYVIECSILFSVFSQKLLYLIKSRKQHSLAKVITAPAKNNCDSSTVDSKNVEVDVDGNGNNNGDKTSTRSSININVDSTRDVSGENSKIINMDKQQLQLFDTLTRLFVLFVISMITTMFHISLTYMAIFVHDSYVVWSLQGYGFVLDCLVNIICLYLQLNVNKTAYEKYCKRIDRGCKNLMHTIAASICT